MKHMITALALAATVGTATAQKIDWKLDKSHSSVGFSVTHMVISTTSGNFGDFDISLSSTGKDFNGATVSGWVDASTVNTNNTDRDAHLKGQDFFDVANHPKIEFKSTSFEKQDDGSYKVKGNLTMRGTTKPVVLNAQMTGAIKDPWGNYRVGWKVEAAINRTEWGLTWNKSLEAGNLLVGEEVTMALSFEVMTTTPPSGN
jgi:polyisoprenoid-binding protein YceI